MQLFVWDETATEKIPAEIIPATDEDFANTVGWQTSWTTAAISAMPNKVALRRSDDGELLGLMSYEKNEKGLAVEVIYIESAGHSNANLLKRTNGKKKYIGIAKALFAYAVEVSQRAGFDGVLYFRSKTSELRAYYIREFGAVPLGQYDPFRLIIWEDAAEDLIAEYKAVNSDG